MSFPTAYLLTWTCYGTWLHGDDRGSVDHDHSQFATPTLSPNPPRSTFERTRLLAPPVSLTTPMRRLVRDTIIEHCAFRDARLLALNVRTNHVHLVAAAQMDPAKLAGHFKARTTRVLREAGLAGATPVWTTYSSTRYLWDENAVAGAVRYTLEDQGPPDEFAVRGG